MIKIERGKVQDGGVVFPRPLELPKGTEVAVSIESVSVQAPVGDVDKAGDFASLPFFGMWAHREEMQDSTAWVRQERERWQQRAARQD